MVRNDNVGPPGPRVVAVRYPRPSPTTSIRSSRQATRTAADSSSSSSSSSSNNSSNALLQHRRMRAGLLAARVVTTTTTTGEARRRKQQEQQRLRRRGLGLYNRAAFERRDRAPAVPISSILLLVVPAVLGALLLLPAAAVVSATQHSSSPSSSSHHPYSSSSSSSSGYHRQQHQSRQHHQHDHHRSTRNNSSNSNSNSNNKKNKKKKKDLYEWLGVSTKEEDRRSCCDDPDRLKRLYRKACLRHHPDKEGGNEGDFKQVTRAYEVLSDPHKRASYDQFGEAGLEINSGNPGGAGGAKGTSGNPFTGSGSGSGSGSSSSSSSGSSSFFSSAGVGPDPTGFTRFSFGGDASSPSSRPFHSFFQQPPSASASASAKTTTTDLNFEELLQELLNGQGVGAGARRRHRQGQGQQGPPRQQHRRHDEVASYERPVHCTLEELYTGATKKLKVSFGNKGGQQQTQQQQKTRLYKVDIQPGYKEGTKISFPAAATTSGGPKMVFVVKERPHPAFRRRGNDLVYRHRLAPPLAGKEQEKPEPRRIRLSIPLLDGTIWTRDIDANSSWVRKGRSITIPDLGMPIRASKTTTTTTTTTTTCTMPDATHGNLIIEFE
jgi:DnaJ homolog subfamily B member 4